MALVTSFTQVSDDTLHCFLRQRPDVVQNYVSRFASTTTLDSATLRNILDAWWMTQAAYPAILGDYIQRLGCPVNAPVATSTGTDTGASAGSTSSQYVMYGAIAIGGLLALKMLKII